MLNNLLEELFVRHHHQHPMIKANERIIPTQYLQTVRSIRLKFLHKHQQANIHLFIRLVFHQLIRIIQHLECQIISQLIIEYHHHRHHHLSMMHSMQNILFHHYQQ